MSNITIGEIMCDPTMNRLAKRINKRFLYMSEADIEYIFQQFEEANLILISKSKAGK